MSKTVIFLTIQLSLSAQFSIVWHMDMIRYSATLPGHSGPGSDGNEGVLGITQSSSISGGSRIDWQNHIRILVVGGYSLCRETVGIIWEFEIQTYHLISNRRSNFVIVKKRWRCPWCNGYRRRKWTRRHEFKIWTRLIAFHTALIPLWKVWIQLFSFQLCVNSRTDWALQPWWGN